MYFLFRCVYVLCVYVHMCQKSVFGVTPQERPPSVLKHTISIRLRGLSARLG